MNVSFAALLLHLTPAAISFFAERSRVGSVELKNQSSSGPSLVHTDFTRTPLCHIWLATDAPTLLVGMVAAPIRGRIQHLLQSLTCCRVLKGLGCCQCCLVSLLLQSLQPFTDTFVFLDWYIGVIGVFILASMFDTRFLVPNASVPGPETTNRPCHNGHNCQQCGAAHDQNVSIDSNAGNVTDDFTAGVARHRQASIWCTKQEENLNNPLAAK